MLVLVLALVHRQANLQVAVVVVPPVAVAPVPTLVWALPRRGARRTVRAPLRHRRVTLALGQKDSTGTHLMEMKQMFQNPSLEI
jgi:hypothetical protein